MRDENDGGARRGDLTKDGDVAFFMTASSAPWPHSATHTERLPSRRRLRSWRWLGRMLRRRLRPVRGRPKLRAI